MGTQPIPCHTRDQQPSWHSALTRLGPGNKPALEPLSWHSSTLYAGFFSSLMLNFPPRPTNPPARQAQNRSRHQFHSAATKTIVCCTETALLINATPVRTDMYVVYKCGVRSSQSPESPVYVSVIRFRRRCLSSSVRQRSPCRLHGRDFTSIYLFVGLRENLLVRSIVAH